MVDKKEPGKFTIKFNVMDPAHRKVIVHLEPMGRTKAQFLANAVLHYLHCSQTPDITQPATIDCGVIEVIVRRILEEQTEMPKAEKLSKVMPQKKLRQSEDIRFEDATALLGEDGMAVIADAMSAFRSK